MTARELIIRIATFLGGLYFFLEFMLPGTVLEVKIDAYHGEISNGLIAIGTMAIGLGIINLVLVHGRTIVFRQAGAGMSIVLLVGLVAMLVVASADWIATARISSDVERLFVLRDFSAAIASEIKDPEKPPPSYRQAKLVEALCKILPQIAEPPVVTNATSLEAQRFAGITETYEQEVGFIKGRCADGLAAEYNPDALQELVGHVSELANARRELLTGVYHAGLWHKAYAILYDGLFVSLGSAMFSLLGFYIAAAAFRAFRVRSAESALMMLAALMVMLGQIPFGPALWERLPDLRLWLLSVPSSGAFRAIKFGAAVAGLVLALRMWLSIESRSFHTRGGGRR